ncbi:hypothetical protein Taro_001369 [Colocasia esculenta]|uniref:Uncharacterized protein n=1 Tax=Colocasia esculenta TaxID=4460 RepID=A0A843T9S0_COLES|nr:hypothetical protein [Colocasia esculenta]
MQGLVQAMQTQAHTQVALQAQLEAQCVGVQVGDVDCVLAAVCGTVEVCVVFLDTLTLVLELYVWLRERRQVLRPETLEVPGMGLQLCVCRCGVGWSPQLFDFFLVERFDQFEVCPGVGTVVTQLWCADDDKVTLATYMLQIGGRDAAVSRREEGFAEEAYSYVSAAGQEESSVPGTAAFGNNQQCTATTRSRIVQDFSRDSSAERQPQ